MPPLPLVSIIIPCYNYAIYLSDAITSALQQTYGNIEIIVVNDGSTDSTASVAALFESKITLYTKPNGGLSNARNFGLNRCHGSLVIFLDADDILRPTYVERLFSVFAQTNDAKLGFVYTQMELFGITSGITNFPHFSVEALKEENYIHATAMMPTTIVQDSHYDESLRSGWEDWDLYLQLVEKGYYGKLVNEPLLRYRRHNSPHRAFANIDDERVQEQLRNQVIKRHPRLFGQI